MSLFGNIIWLICGGFLSGLGYILGGALVCLTIVGIPFGKQAIKLGIATLAPFGREPVTNVTDKPGLQLVLNLIWMFVLGWGIAVSHLVHALILAITIVGLPFAWQHLKLVPLSLFPFGRDLVKTLR